jgi:hypothetical protein
MQEKCAFFGKNDDLYVVYCENIRTFAPLFSKSTPCDGELTTFNY